MDADNPEGTGAEAGGRLAQRLRRVALAHLERYATSEDGLRRVLERRLARWARLPAGAITVEPEEGARLVAAAVSHCRGLGLLDDRAFAETKIASGRRKGHSTRRIAMTLQEKGVARDLAADVLAADETGDLEAALTYARRMRLGPFRTRPVADEAAAGRRELAALCRNGHPYGPARRALAMEREEAEDLLAGRAGETS